MQIEPDKRWATKEEKVNEDVSGVLLMVSLKLLLSPVMMISKRDRILTACRTRGYFHGRTQRRLQNKPTPAPPGTRLPAAAGLSWAPSMIRAQLVGYLGLRVAGSMFKGALRKPAMNEELGGGKRIPQHVVPAWVPRSQLQTRVPQSKSTHARLD